MCCKKVSITEYVLSAKSVVERIKNIDTLIDMMLLSSLEAQQGKDPSIKEYQMNDGQMTVRTEYRNYDDLIKGIESLERIRNRYLSMLNGRKILLRNIKGRR